MAPAARNSRAPSREPTASMLFAVGPSKPSARAVRSRSRGRVEPASAPEPSGQRARRARRSAKRRRVPGEELDEREPVVGEPHRLRALEVRVAREQRVDVLARAQGERALEPDEPALGGGRRVPQVEGEVGRDLVVAAAPRVEAPRDRADQVAEPRLDVHVDVLEARVVGEAALLDLRGDPLEAGDQGGGVGRGQDARGAEHARRGRSIPAGRSARGRGRSGPRP